MSCTIADKPVAGSGNGIVIYSFWNCCFSVDEFSIEWVNKDGQYVTWYGVSARDSYGPEKAAKAVIFSYGNYRLSVRWAGGNVPYVCNREVIPFQNGSANITVTDKPEGVACTPGAEPYSTDRWINLHNTCFVLLRLRDYVWVYSTLYGWAPGRIGGDVYPGTLGWSLRGYVIIEPEDMVFWGVNVKGGDRYRIRSFPANLVESVYEILPNGLKHVYPPVSHHPPHRAQPKEVGGLYYRYPYIFFMSNYTGQAKLIVDGKVKIIPVVTGVNKKLEPLPAGAHQLCVEVM